MVVTRNGRVSDVTSVGEMYRVKCNGFSAMKNNGLVNSYHV